MPANVRRVDSVVFSGSHAVVITTTTSVANGTAANRTDETAGPAAANQTEPYWSSAATTTAKTVTATMVTVTGSSDVDDDDGDKTTTTTVPTVPSTSAGSSSSASTTSVSSSATTGYGNKNGGTKDVNRVGGSGSSDERDGETMDITSTNHAVVYGGEILPTVVTPTPAKPTEPPIHTKAAESTTFIVMVTTATLIVIVLIILLVLKVKYRTDTNRYKMDLPKTYAHEPGSDRGGLCQQQHQQQHNVNLLSPGNYPSSRQSTSPTYVQNNFNNNNRPKKRQDVKEWYV